MGRLLMLGRVHEHDEVAGLLEGTAPALGSRRPPTAVPSDHDEGMPPECERDRPGFVAAEVHTEAGGDAFLSQSSDEGLGFDRRETVRLVHGHLAGYRAEVN